MIVGIANFSQVMAEFARAKATAPIALIMTKTINMSAAMVKPKPLRSPDFASTTNAGQLTAA